MPRRRKRRYKPYINSVLKRRYRHFPSDNDCWPQIQPTTLKELYPITVKVENLSKRTTPDSLKKKLNDIGKLLDVRVQECPAASVNYANVNCMNNTFAQEAILELHDKLLDGNLLKAEIKGSYEDLSTYSRSESSQPASTWLQGIATVKVLISGRHLFITGKQLDKYFSKYGELTAPSKIYLGSPDYAYINFKSPLSAQECLTHSPHSIQGVEVVALPHKNRYAYSNSSYFTMERSEYTCNPLVISYVMKEADSYLQAQGYHIKVVAETPNQISLFSPIKIPSAVDHVMKWAIFEHQTKIRNREESFDCCYLPALVDHSVQMKLHEIQVFFNLHIKQVAASEEKYDSLEALTQAYNNCTEVSDRRSIHLPKVSVRPTVHAPELKPYLSPNGSTQHQWYWEKELSVFKPYDKTICEHLEQALASSEMITVSIGSREYKINTATMLQKNTATGKERRIKREVQYDSEQYTISIRITAHAHHIKEVQREVSEILRRVLTETFLDIPNYENASYVDNLLKKARKIFLSADRDAERRNSIVLRGVLGEEKKLAIKIQEEILEKQTKLTKLAQLKASYQNPSIPSYWEAQENVCELKHVVRGSKEWNEVEEHTSFQIHIVQIERIQNPWLWEVYVNSRKRMSEKNKGIVNERKLFHGTRSTSPKKIYGSEQGFDNRKASKGMWGKGIYFAVKASYSDRYAHHTAEGDKQMFLASVLTGVSCECPRNWSMKAPPMKSELTLSGSQASYKFEDERYDSVKGNTNDSEIFVIYENGKVYPDYLITYTI